MCTTSGHVSTSSRKAVHAHRQCANAASRLPPPGCAAGARPAPPPNAAPSDDGAAECCCCCASARPSNSEDSCCRCGDGCNGAAARPGDACRPRGGRMGLAAMLGPSMPPTSAAMGPSRLARSASPPSLPTPTSRPAHEPGQGAAGVRQRHSKRGRARRHHCSPSWQERPRAWEQSTQTHTHPASAATGMRTRRPWGPSHR